MIVTVDFTRPGKGTTQFTERLVIDRIDVKVLLLDTHDAQSIYAGTHLILGHQAPIVWFVFPDQWYEVGRFHDADGRFTGWYTNLCTPFDISGAQWSTTDLFLDLWQPVNGKERWLDEDELRDATANGLLDQSTAERVAECKASISQSCRDGSWPPAVTKQIDLAAARAGLKS